MPDEFVPEHIATILKCRTHDKAALDIVNKWFLDDLANARPDLNKFERNCWKSRLEMFERRLQQAYRNLQADDPVASSGEAIRVFRPQDTAKGRTKQFNDELEDDFDKPKNLEQLVLSVCRRESYEWQRFQKLNNLFYVPVDPSLSVVGEDGVQSLAQEDEPQYDIKDEELANGILSFEPHATQEGFCRSQARIVVALGGNGCLAPWECVFDPVQRRHRRIDGIRGSWHVLSRNAVTGVLEVRDASEPYIRKVADVFDVVLSTGAHLHVTNDHRVVDASGRWITVEQAWRLQIPLAFDESSRRLLCESSRQFESDAYEDGYRSRQCISGFCTQESFRTYGPPRLVQDTFQGDAPPQVGAHEHTQRYWREDVAAHSGERNLTCRSSRRLSSLDGQRQASVLIGVPERQVASVFLGFRGLSIQSDAQSDQQIASRASKGASARRSSEETFFALTHPEKFVLGIDRGICNIKSMTRIGSFPVWDFSCPPFANYIHAGLTNAQSGKTEVLCRLAGWELLQGTRSGRLPVHGWCVRPSYSDDISTDPIFAKLWFGDGDNLPIIPPHFQEKLTGNPKKVMHTTLGSTLSIRTWSQGFQRQQGHSPDFVLIDEECDDVFFTELCVRMFRRAKGWIGAAITDTTAPHWALELEERFNRGDPNVYVCRMRTNDNPYISKEQVAVFSEGMDDIEKSIRLEGGLVLAGGAVYKCWSDKNWRDRSDLPLDGTDYVFIDPGISNPCAVIWVRVMKPEMRKTSSGADKLISDIWLIGEYYRRGVSDIAQHVAEIRAMNQALCSRPVKYYIDPWTGAAHVHKVGEPQVVMDVWRRAGIPVVPASSKRDMYRLERFRETEKHIKHSEIDYPNLYALRDMKYFRRELLKYVVSGLVTPRIKSSRQRSEEFSGDNHLIFGMECAVVMKPRYISEYTAETAVMTQGQILGRLAWERMDQENVPLFTSGDLGVMLEPKDVPAETTTTDASVA